MPANKHDTTPVALIADSSVHKHTCSATCVSRLHEDELRSQGFLYIAGVDEVGRGCLAGPVVAAAVILDPTVAYPQGLNDSKKLSARQRERIGAELQQCLVTHSIGAVEADEIDRINILQATKLAMRKAVAGLDPVADFLLIDALTLEQITLPQRGIIRGDSISASIAAASILAKTYRDRLMAEYDQLYPQFGFARHVGYGTSEHLSALANHGYCPLHRKSFRGVLPARPALG
jgi:ribonuclease HII